jgi:hypothetical protein
MTRRPYPRYNVPRGLIWEKRLQKKYSAKPVDPAYVNHLRIIRYQFSKDKKAQPSPSLAFEDKLTLFSFKRTAAQKTSQGAYY